MYGEEKTKDFKCSDPSVITNKTENNPIVFWSTINLCFIFVKYNFKII